MKGIDISEFQSSNNINYEVLSKNIEFAIIRAGGTGYESKKHYKDAEFETHYKKLSQYNVPIGAYWYSTASNESEAKSEANEFLRVIAGKSFKFPVFIDVEEPATTGKQSPATITNIILTFGDIVEKAGYYFGVYCNQYWLQNKMNYERLKRFDFWIANWSASSNPVPMIAGIWQATSSGRIAGYSGNLDINYTDKNYPEIIVNNGLNGFTNKIEAVKKKITMYKDIEINKSDEEKIDELLKLIGFNKKDKT